MILCSRFSVPLHTHKCCTIFLIRVLENSLTLEFVPARLGVKLFVCEASLRHPATHEHGDLPSDIFSNFFENFVLRFGLWEVAYSGQHLWGHMGRDFDPFGLSDFAFGLHI
jgi:hypothetical protein